MWGTIAITLQYTLATFFYSAHACFFRLNRIKYAGNWFYFIANYQNTPNVVKPCFYTVDKCLRKWTKAYPLLPLAVPSHQNQFEPSFKSWWTTSAAPWTTPWSFLVNGVEDVYNRKTPNNHPKLAKSRCHSYYFNRHTLVVLWTEEKDPQNGRYFEMGGK